MEEKIQIQEVKFGSQDMSNYEKKEKIGEGTFGNVYKAKDKKRDKLVAIKKIALQKNGEVSLECWRQIGILRDLKHPNIISLLDVIPTKSSMCLIFEYCETDLKTLLKAQNFNENLDPFTIKKIMYGLICGIAEIHKKKIIHRDLKTENILLTKQGELKIADFGIARTFTIPNRPWSDQIMTLWYRAPQIIFGCSNYSTPIDIWSTGCIFAELVTKQVLFQQQTQTALLLNIFSKLGIPNPNQFPKLTKFNSYQTQFVIIPPHPLQDSAVHLYLDKDGFDLLSKMLVYNPQKRITAEEALKHVLIILMKPYFDEVRNISDLRIDVTKKL